MALEPVEMAASADENCNRDCAECLPQFATASSGLGLAVDDVVQTLTDADAGTWASSLVASIGADRKYLLDKLQGFGDLIASRWKKKSRQKRMAIMLEARPGLYHCKWPELRIRFGCDKIEGQDGSIIYADMDQPDFIVRAQEHAETTRVAHLLPYLNVETLKSDPHRLLGLLHNRAAYSPETWVMFDVSRMKSGLEHGNASRSYNPHCIIMYGENYGRLVPWDRTRCHSWDCVGFPCAILVLDSQAMLLRFLRDMVDLLVKPGDYNNDTSHSVLLSPKVLRASGQIESWNTMTNQAFSPPPMLDPTNTLQQAQAQLDEAEDHLYLLQADPTYIHSYIAGHNRSEHVAQMETRAAWEMLVDEIMGWSAAYVRDLRDLVDECKHVVAMHAKHHDNISVGSALPKEYERSLMALELLCINLYLPQVDVLAVLLRKCPGFSGNFERIKTEDGKHAVVLRCIDGTGDSTSESYFQHQPLLYALHALTQTRHIDEVFKISFFMSFVEDHLAQANPKERARVNQAIYDQLARMCLYAQIWTVLRMHRPRHSSAAFDLMVMNDEEKGRRAWAHADCDPESPTTAEYDNLIRLLNAFFQGGVPTGKHDQAWLNGMTEARTSLRNFWSEAGNVRARCIADEGYNEGFIAEDAAMFSAETTSRYAADLAADLASLLISKKEPVSTTTYTEQTIWSSTQEEKSVPDSHVKIKTRPDDKPTTSNDALDDQDEATKDASTTISVSAESLRIFSKMFPGSSADAYKGTVKWQQVVTAMQDAGCTAQHNGGSMVSFNVPDAVPRGGRIVFHKPHPENDVDLFVLRTMGKRMKAWFGWSADIFVLRKKAAD